MKMNQKTPVFLRILCVLMVAVIFVSSNYIGASTVADATSGYTTSNAVMKAKISIPYFNNRYYLKRLSAAELADFCTLYDAYQNFKTSVYLPYQISRQKFEALMFYLDYECPELIQYTSDVNYTYWYNSYGNVTRAQLPYSMSKSTYTTAIKQVKSKITAITNACKGKSVLATEKYIHNYIIKNMSYNDRSYCSFNSYGVLIKKQGRCEGISRTAKWVLDRLGISNYIVWGKKNTDTVAHTWNRVYNGGAFYELDITHDNTDYRTNCGNEVISYGLVNVGRGMVGDQYDKYAWANTRFAMPCSNSMAKCWALAAGNYAKYGTSATSKLSSILKKNVKAKSKNMYMQVSTKTEYTKLIKSLRNGWLSNWLNKNATNKWRYCTYWYFDESRTVYIHLDYYR